MLLERLQVKVARVLGEGFCSSNGCLKPTTCRVTEMVDGSNVASIRFCDAHLHQFINANDAEIVSDVSLSLN